MKEKLSLFDLHCDTALSLFNEKSSLYDNENCHISLKRAEYLKNYVQFFAVFTPSKMSDAEGFDNFQKVVDNFKSECEIISDKIKFPCKTAAEITDALNSGKRAAVLTVEDARIIENDLNRIDLLFNKGVRIITPVWGGDSCIGGAHNTNNGLTNFGYSAVTKMVQSGIIPDISHSSVKTASEIMDIAEKYNRPAIATHSDSLSVHNHSRNLSDDQFKRIKSLGGIVGISLCVSHLSGESANVDSVVKHIDKYMELSGEDTVCIGCDLDGTNLPDGLEGIQDLYKIAERLENLGYPENLIHKIFFDNAMNFANKNLIK